MSDALVAPRAGHARRRPRTRRVSTVAAAAAATGLGWLVGRLGGADYVVTTPFRARQITLGLAVLATGFAGTAGWILLAVLERYTSHARITWTVLAVAVLGASVVPIVGFPAGAATRVALTGLHCLAAAICIAGLPNAGRPRE